MRPSEKSLEVPYIQRNIDATRAAYGLSGIVPASYDTKTVAAPGQLRGDAATVPGIRLIDPNVVSPTFKQLEASKGYYQFADVLDVDRYQIDGKSQDTVIAARELDLNGVPDAQRNWLNDHTVYTHGYGVVAAKGNTREPDGRPTFIESQIGTTGALGKYEPRIYFGESSPEYSVVGGNKQEFDYPDPKGTGQINYTYAGTGGVQLDAIKRLAYAVKYREINFLLSDAVTNDSRVLDHRTPRDRVQRVAPWLTLDGNAYPAVVDGRVQWILDGYTTSASYPYSENTTLDTATEDAVTSTRTAVRAVQAGQVNYVRNSVKATVDAYDGTVTLYQWDEQDPVLKAWMSIFPGTVKPLSDIKGSLMAHLRYPEDLFKVQRRLLAEVPRHGWPVRSTVARTSGACPTTRRNRRTTSCSRRTTSRSPCPTSRARRSRSRRRSCRPVTATCCRASSPSTATPGARPARGRRTTASCACSRRRAGRSTGRGRSTTTCAPRRSPPTTRRSAAS